MSDKLSEGLINDPSIQNSPEIDKYPLAPEEQFFAGVSLIALIKHKVISEKEGDTTISTRLSDGVGGRIRRVEYMLMEEVVRIGDVEIRSETVMMPTNTVAADKLDDVSKQANLHFQRTTIKKDDDYELRMRVFRDGGWDIDGAYFKEPVMSQQFRVMQDIDDQGWGVKISTRKDFNQLIGGTSPAGKWLTSAISHFVGKDDKKPLADGKRG